MSDDIKLSKAAKGILDEVKKLPVLELADLVKAMEEEFGVSSAPLSGVAAAPVAGGAGEAAEEKSSFNIELVSPGGQKIAAIKAVREISGLGLKEAKDLVDAAPKVIKENVKKEEAEEMKKKLEEAGATVELK
jgi:large subunit ribosomal protein L7/L12